MVSLALAIAFVNRIIAIFRNIDTLTFDNFEFGKLSHVHYAAPTSKMCGVELQYIQL